MTGIAGTVPTCRLSSELKPAIMPNKGTRSVTTQRLGATDRLHAVRFYKNADSLCELVANFLGEGLRQDQAAVVIATPAHVDGIVQRLDAQALDVQHLQQTGTLALLDAQATLDQFMTDGMPVAEAFAETLTPILDRVSLGGDRVIRAYGEMVDVLWKNQQTVAATRLEMLWNELARSHTFSLLCGYAMGSFYKEAAVEEICSHHTHILSAEGVVTLAG
jgi:hypothetical protein